MMRSTMKQSSFINSRLIVIALLVCAFSIHESFGQQQLLTAKEIAELLTRDEPQKYCSHALNRVMREVCALKRRLKPRNSKKSYNNDLESDVFDVDRIGASGGIDIDYDIFGGAMQQETRGHRIARGIVDECCNQPCHKYQLLKYSCESY